MGVQRAINGQLITWEVIVYGFLGMEQVAARYKDPWKAAVYRLAELNRQIRAERRKLALCRKTQNSLPRMEQEIDKAEARESEVRTNEHRRR